MDSRKTCRRRSTADRELSSISTKVIQVGEYLVADGHHQRVTRILRPARGCFRPSSARRKHSRCRSVGAVLRTCAVLGNPQAKRAAVLLRHGNSLPEEGRCPSLRYLRRDGSYLPSRGGSGSAEPSARGSEAP